MVFTVQEVAVFLGMTVRQVQHLAETNKLLKRHKGTYAFAQSDINSFLTRLNAGQVAVGVRRKKKAGERSSTIPESRPR